MPPPRLGDRVPRAPGPLARIRTHASVPLYRGAYALIASSAATSALGLVYWMAAARLYRPDVVGSNSVLLSAMFFLSGLGQLGLHAGLLRFLPAAGGATRRLLARIYGTGALVTAVVGLACFRMIAGSPASLAVAQSSGMLWWFAVSTVGWTIMSMQETALAAMRRASWVPPVAVSFSAAKIVLLVWLVDRAPRLGVFLSWTIPSVVITVIATGVVFRHVVPRHTAESPEAPMPGPGRVLAYMGASLWESGGYLAATYLVPIVVAARAGHTATAHFYAAWTIVAAARTVAVGMTTSLTVEATRDASRLNELCLRVIVHTCRLVVPLVLVLALGAPVVLRLFGPDYAVHASWLLRLLALSMIPNIIVLVHASYSRVRLEPLAIAVCQGVTAAAALSLAYVLAGSAGLAGVGWAWLITEAGAALVLFATRLRPLLRGWTRTDRPIP